MLPITGLVADGFRRSSGILTLAVSRQEDGCDRQRILLHPYLCDSLKPRVWPFDLGRYAGRADLGHKGPYGIVIPVSLAFREDGAEFLHDSRGRIVEERDVWHPVGLSVAVELVKVVLDLTEVHL